MPKKTTDRLTRAEQLNFLLTNRIPRRWATLFVGWISRRRNSLVRRCSIALWGLFAGDLRLEEARTTRFESMHECFIRELKPGARPVCAEPGVLVSPCDAVVGMVGDIHGTRVFQAKGFPYSLGELLGDETLAVGCADGVYVSLRLRANMYHRFHAPEAACLREVHYLSGDTWNVNPIALRCIERLYCRNERAVLPLYVADLRAPVLLVAVAAIAVASIRIHGLDQPLGLRYRGTNTLFCHRSYRRGEEMGYFQQGSTIIVLAPPGIGLAAGVARGVTLRMGQPLLARTARLTAGPGSPVVDVRRGRAGHPNFIY